jgi:hypothetical protein
VSPLANKIVAPFLGNASATFTIANIADYPIDINALRMSGPDSENFFVAGPGQIKAHDSAAYVVTLFDNDKLKDLVSNIREAVIKANVSVHGTDKPCLDSDLNINVSGKIDVYCPNYFSSVPRIGKGIHPAGIIFSYSHNQLDLIFHNSDSETREFYPPYYEDLLLSISIRGRTLPASILPFTDLIGTQTTFTPDAAPMHLTRLRWPRDVDTVSIDVLALGSNYRDEVFSASPRQNIPIWPNPTSGIIHLNSEAMGDTEFSLCDLFGRVLRHGRFDKKISLDLSGLPNGLYGLRLGKSQTTFKVQILR